MTQPPPAPLAAAAATIARLEARVAALEAALERRSRELRAIQQHVCRRDLQVIACAEAGLPAPPPESCDPLHWRETTEATPADVEEALVALWGSLLPLAARDGRDSR